MKKTLCITLVFLLIVSAVSFANGGGEGKAAADDELTIVVMPKLVGIPYFNAAEKGAVAAGKDLGVNVIYTGPTTADAAQQVRMVEDFIARGVDCIAVAPNDPAAMTPVLRKAQQAGVLIMDWDTPADPSVVDISVHQIDDVEYGQMFWDKLVEFAGKDTMDYAIITGGLSAANLNCWIDAGLKYAAAKYPGLNLLTERVPSDEKQQVAYQKALELIKAYPSMEGLICFSSPAPIGAGQAIQEKGLQNDITVIGCALPNDARPYIKDGSVDAALLWDPATLSYLTVYLAKKALTGEAITDGMEVPNVGKIGVSADGKTIIMGAPSEFNKDTVDNYDF